MSPLHVAAGSGDAELLERVLAALQRAGRERQPKAARRSFAKTVRPCADSVSFDCRSPVKPVLGRLPQWMNFAATVPLQVALYPPMRTADASI